LPQTATSGVVSILFALALIPAAASAQAPARTWVVSGATLIDGTGARPVSPAVVVGQGDRIVCAGRAADCEIPRGAATVNAAGKWIIPGLIDTHVHLTWSDEFTGRAQLIRLAFGTTTTRDAGTPAQLQRTLAARSRADEPSLAEPRLVVSGLVSAGKNQQTPEAVTELVRNLAAQGVDAIKIKQDFPPDAFAALTREAHAFGLPVFGHTWGREGSFLPATLAAGIDGVSHMYTFSEYGSRADPSRPPAPQGLAYWVWTKELWNYQDDARLNDALEKLVQQRVWLEPMLVTEKHFTFDYPLPAGAEYLGEMRTVEQIVRDLLPVGDSGWLARGRRRQSIDAVYRKMCDFVGRFHARGGVVLTATDGLQPGIALLEEVARLAECGLSPMDALRAATEQPAIALNRADLGTVEAGKRADFVILDGDPLADPANLRRVHRVLKGGHVHDPASLLQPLVAEHGARQLTAWAIRAAGGSSILAVLGALTVIQHRRRRQRSAPA
jgi:imidazolonepropionase-like amidohydrolase